MKFQKASSVLIFFLLALPLWAQFEIPDKPAIQTSVYDYVNLLSPEEKRDLEQELIRYSDSTSTQIVAAIIGSTKGENISYLGANWAHKWGIGQEGKDNGIFILLAKDDRKIAINTGYGVEGSLTDAISRRIIENVIIPEFKNGDYFIGLKKGSNAIFEVLSGEFVEERTFDQGGDDFSWVIPLLIFVVILIVLSSRNRRNGGGRGGRGGGSDFWDSIILSNMGRSGGFGGGFGGGGFGGGGASGGW